MNENVNTGWVEQWRPVEMTLPKKNKVVLVKTNTGRLCYGKYDGEHFYWSKVNEHGNRYKFILEDIVAWAPQPRSFWEHYGGTIDQLPAEVGYPYVLGENKKLEAENEKLRKRINELKYENDELIERLNKKSLWKRLWALFSLR